MSKNYDMNIHLEKSKGFSMWVRAYAKAFYECYDEQEAGIISEKEMKDKISQMKDKISQKTDEYFREIKDSKII